MPNLAVKIEGLPQAQARLRALGSAMGPVEVQGALLSGATLLPKRARQIVTRSSQRITGQHLAEALFSSRGRQRPEAPSVIAGVSRRRAPHGIFVEYGTGPRRLSTRTRGGIRQRTPTGRFAPSVGGRRRWTMYGNIKFAIRRFFGREVAPMQAKPFLRPALRQTREPMVVTISNSLRKLVDGAASS